MVHAHDDGDVFALRRSGDDDLLGTGHQVALGLVGFGEESGGLDDDVHAERLPGEFSRGLGGNDADLGAIHDQDVVFGLVRRGLGGADGAGEAALGGVVLEQVRQVVCGDDVTHRDDVDVLAHQSLLDESAEDQTADTAETIDRYIDCHNVRFR